MTSTVNLFLYGTLRHDTLLSVVAGETLTPVPAALADHIVCAVEGQSFPIIVSSETGSANGILVSMSPEARARLDYYEGGYGYGLKSVSVETAEGRHMAEVYFPEPGLWSPSGDWSLERWVEEHGTLTIAAAREAMSHYGRWSAKELALRFPRLRARAWSHHLAQVSAPTMQRAATTEASVDVISQQNRHSGFFALDEITLDHPTFDGGTSGPVHREVFVSSDASLVLPYDPVRDRVLLVEQFRAGAFGRGDPHPWILEPVAGLVDPGETPETAAHREAREEAGVSFTHLEPVIAGYPSPGATTEFYHCFVGLCALGGNGGNGGLPEEDEDIRTHILDRQKALDLIDTGEANVIPLVMLMLWVDRHRARLAALA